MKRRISTPSRRNVDFPVIELAPSDAIVEFAAPGLPPSLPTEAEVFARQRGIPGHNQELVEKAHITQIGAGGIGSLTGQGLVRSGSCQTLTISDPDRVERSNLHRQLFSAADIGKWKAFALAENLVLHAVSPTQIIAIAWPFEKAMAHLPQSSDLLIVGVDNNACRLAGARFARERRIPAVFTMLSDDGMRMHCFLQWPASTDACLRCALPNLVPGEAMPCANAIITSCFLAAAATIFFCHRALMGWSAGVKPFNWRAADLLAQTPERTGFVTQRPNCPTCGPLRDCLIGST